MAGKQCLDDRVGGFRGARLTHHDHVGVGTQEAAQNRSKRQVDLAPYFHLSQTALGNLNWAFHCPDFSVRPVDMGKDRMQRRRLARTRRPADEHEAMGPVSDAFKPNQRVIGKVEGVH